MCVKANNAPYPSSPGFAINVCTTRTEASTTIDRYRKLAMEKRSEPFPLIHEDDVQESESTGPTSEVQNSNQQLLVLKHDTMLEVLDALKDRDLRTHLRYAFASHSNAKHLESLHLSAGLAGEEAFFEEIESYIRRTLPHSSRELVAKDLRAELKSCLAIAFFELMYEWNPRETTGILTSTIGRATKSYTPQKVRNLLEESDLAKEVMCIWDYGVDDLIRRYVLQDQINSECKCREHEC